MVTVYHVCQTWCNFFRAPIRAEEGNILLHWYAMHLDTTASETFDLKKFIPRSESRGRMSNSLSVINPKATHETSYANPATSIWWKHLWHSILLIMHLSAHWDDCKSVIIGGNAICVSSDSCPCGMIPIPPYSLIYDLLISLLRPCLNLHSVLLLVRPLLSRQTCLPNQCL